MSRNVSRLHLGSARRVAPRSAVLSLACALGLAGIAAPAGGATPWTWDQGGDGIDDRLQAVALGGIEYAFENLDPDGRLRFEVAEAGSLLSYGAYVRYFQAPTESDSTALAGLGAQVVTVFRSAPYIRIHALYPTLLTISARPEVDRIEAVTLMYPVNLRGTRAMGVRGGRGAPFPSLESSGGPTGRGTVVAVLDTGINDAPSGLFPGHRDLIWRVLGGANYSGIGPVGYTPWGLSTNPDQSSAGLSTYHGTHVAGTIAGGPRWRLLSGVAPDARLVDVKVLNDDGSGFGLAEGLEWCLQNAQRPWGGGLIGIDVINLSVCGIDSSDGSDCACALVDSAAAHGIVVVAAAGNTGSCGGLPAPAAADGAISVAAADLGLDAPAAFSSAGPRPDDLDLSHADEMKPDVTAPGVDVVSAWGLPVSTGTGYQALSGTSMATAFVSGLVALLREAAPAITPAEVKSLLRTTARHRSDSGPACSAADPFGLDPRYHTSWGFGEVDALAAMEELLNGSRTQFVRVSADWNGTAGRMDVRWTTQREADLDAFAVERAPDADGLPGSFVPVSDPPVPAMGYGDLTLGNRTDYLFEDDVPAGGTWWYRIVTTGGGAADTSSMRQAWAEPETSRAWVSFRHNTPETDLTLGFGTGLNLAFPDWSESLVLHDAVDSVWASELLPGGEILRCSASAPLHGIASVYLPPSAGQPWWLRADEGGQPARQGEIDAFVVVSDGTPHATGSPTPSPTHEGNFTALWIPEPISTGIATDEVTAPDRALGVSPNPFAGRARILVKLASAESVTLTVHDVIGRHVRELHAGVLDAGEHAFVWDGLGEGGAQEPVGRYYLLLRRAGGRSVAPIVLLR